MAEYIEREALCKILENWRNAHADVDDEQGCGLLEDVICEVDAQTAADVAPVGWISVKDRLQEPETEVLAVCVRNGFRFVVPAIYEDGTVLSQDSTWNWYDLDTYGTYSEENDDYFVPAGWWENREFTPDDVYNNPVDCAVTHWMPLPEPPEEVRGNE